ncbi:NAD(P)/FAD-dependent oxidoreductase [Thalassorhabdomicrobium marinisediminis]|uniref:FAD-binding oxidoreductase n=1 Tax=Thalassorhabdomicrobium marinisediminis TaxID=2170577 RepID=A0A2T7FV54_9RHOB|nr:FAD-dependent oxidoreductase [Thalassorhabdomicrobium marinisediminis]PVA06035.1 FAD-binding oxidoreductase [Thalassorhabdomicrobium marinisediminis]
MRVIVVGAGIIGASVAYALSRRGCDVTVIDGGLPAASEASFGWINASFYADAAHHRLRVAGMQAHEALQTALPDLPIRRTGALCFEEQGAAMARTAADLAALSYGVKTLDAARIAELEPALAQVPQAALRFDAEQAAEPAAMAQRLLAASGARLVRGLRVAGVTARETVTGVRTQVGDLPADRVVIAAGCGAPEILASVGVRLPMLTRPGVLVTTQQHAPRLNHILVTPHGELRHLPDGRLLASAVANHQGDDAEKVEETPEQIGARVMDWLRPLVGAPDLQWAQVALAHRPVPEDGLPVIGHAGPQGLHIAVMHSGVTLAAITGQVTADEVTGAGGHDALLAPYRPARFQP